VFESTGRNCKNTPVETKIAKGHHASSSRSQTATIISRRINPKRKLNDLGLVLSHSKLSQNIEKSIYRFLRCKKNLKHFFKANCFDSSCSQMTLFVLHLRRKRQISVYPGDMTAYILFFSKGVVHNDPFLPT
jgi:hypothetical protein